jgi:integrase
VYLKSILNNWIPFLKKNFIKNLEEINTPLLARYQDYCLAKGLKPQTVNHYVSFVSSILDYLVLRGQIKINPCKGLTTLKVKQEDQKVKGCYNISKLKGVFNKKWKNEISYMLSLIMYTTNMRNSEIEKIQVKDIFVIDKIHFIDIDESKTKNGVRIVPLHDFVYRKIMIYIKKHKLKDNDYLFKLPNCKRLGSKRYKDAYLELAEYTGYNTDRLKKENITFYSGRHFWKTLMNSAGLGEVEEYFMGHKVSNDVAKRYNHRDRQGQVKLAERAGRVFKILNAKLFTS